MMEFIKSYMMTLCGCALISTLVISAFPAGNMKNALKFTVGLVMAMIIISPLTGGTLPLLEFPAFEKAEAAVDYQSIEKMEELQRDQVLLSYSNKLTQSIREIIEENGGDPNVSITVETMDSGEIEKIEIYDITLEIKNKIIQTLKIEESRVTVIDTEEET